MLKIQKHFKILASDPVRALQLYNVCRQSALIVIGILLAKSHLSTAQIGIYELLLYLGTVLSFFWIDGLLKALVSSYAGKTPQQKQRMLFSIYLIFLAISILLGLLLMLFRPVIVPFFTGKADIPHYALYVMFLVAYVPSFLVPYFQMLEQKARTLIAFSVFSALCHLAAIGIPIIFGLPLQSIFVGLICFGLLMHGYMLLWSIPRWSTCLDLSQILQLFTLAVPLMGYAVAAGLAKLFDSWLVNFVYADEATFAIFRYGARELPLSVGLISAVSLGVVPLLVEKQTAGLRDLSLRVGKLMHLLFPVSTVLVLASPFLFPVIFNTEFRPSAFIFNIYLLLLVSQILLPNAILLAKKQTRIILLVSVIELGVNVGLSLVLVRHFGLEGIALATVVAFMLEKLIFALIIWRKYRIGPAEYINLQIYLLYTATLLGACVLSFIYLR